MRIGEYVADHGVVGKGDYRAARDLLMRVAPRLHGQEFEQTGESPTDTALRVALHLDESVFPVQGPPGAGKTHTGARMICALARVGQTVGVTANSHTVIGKLLDEAVGAAGKDGYAVRCMQKVTDKESDRPGVKITTSNPAFLSALQRDFHLGGATAWFWARPDAKGAVDVLFIDEAAQMSLANVLAVSQAANSLVLLGDPRQLEQPIQESHPDGVAVSALDHLLGTHATVPLEHGLFLPVTWRLHPSICSFHSELFYEGRLRSLPELRKQEIRSNGRLKGAGLRYSAVEHTGNQSSSPEEVERVCALVDEILQLGTSWVDRDDIEAPVTLKDILIIAPYNAQVFALQERLPSACIGTVDKFQGQEAPIVIYSMTTSSHADAPRGMEFLYSANRLNVAISRAKCMCIVVASPALFEAECRTPRQMQLANAFCRYLEIASPI
ncbi:DEAD/DEAH box helicase [Bradyrhizobium hereditatis]|uniref:DEAD/DEAH box helicase n=1 Tax=Bradyrhizobium hereditatis TaxID=2821405 RepID=UPI001CE2770C|nr:ATP-binding protein [Bradyrhizobium hereditatis]